MNSFEAFLEDMGVKPSFKHSIDRIDNNGNYEPGNCRWATAKEQSRNTRVIRLITYEGRTQCLVAWAEELGIPAGVLNDRLNRSKWSVEKAFSTPVRQVKQVKQTPQSKNLAPSIEVRDT